MQYIDDNYAYLGCCRKDKKCNVYFLGLYKYFYVLDETWSDYQTFRTYSTGILPGFTNGEAIINIKISYTDSNKCLKTFNFSPLLPREIYETCDMKYDPKRPAFSLRPGRYYTEVKISIFRELNSLDGKKPFSTVYIEKISFEVLEDDNDVVIMLFATQGAKYKKYERYSVLYNKKVLEREFVDHQFEHNFIQSNGETARKFYKWYDLNSDLILNVPNGTPWGLKTANPTNNITNTNSSTPKQTTKPTLPISKPKPKTSKTSSGSKTTSTTNVTKTASATQTTDSKTKIIKKDESVIPADAVNILIISTKTKVGKFYKIENVENKAKKIYIDDTVSEISRLAFQACSILEEIYLGKNLKVLELGLFNNCRNLKTVHFVEGLTTIKNNVFDNTYLIGKIKLPETINSIGEYAFNVRRPSILEIEVSKDTKYFDNSFSLCKVNTYEPKMTTKKQEEKHDSDAINILDICTKTKIGNFYRVEKVDNVATKIYVDDTVSEISKSAFQTCYHLEEITLGKNLKVLEFGLFNNLLNLKKVNFVEGLINIGNNVFDRSGLTGYHKLPQSLESIGNLAFNVKLPNYLQLSLSKETKLEEKSIHRLIKVDYYEPTKSKPNTNKPTTTSPSKKIVETKVNFPPQPITTNVNHTTVNSDYEEGKKIYNKYSGKKKMLEAAKLMEAKADTGDLEACELVLKAYTYAEKFNQADKYVELFIKQKKADIIFWFADKLEFVKGYGNRSKDLFLIAAENGIIDAYEKVASYYFGHNGVPKDYNKVMEYYLKGANLGSAVCLRHLANIYSAGLEGVVKPNKKEYISFVKKAAEAGDSVAQYWLGFFYLKGKNGFPVDKKQANYWFEKSANNPKNPSSFAKLALNGDYSQIE